MYWCFTINNPTSNEMPRAWPGVQYAVWQREKGEAGTEHLQGYAVFTLKKERTWTNGKCNKGHWEPRKGNHAQAKAYCTKEDTRIAGPWELGEELEEWGSQGKRNDLRTLKRKLDEGKTETEIATDDETFPVWAKYRHAIKAYQVLTRQNERDWATHTTVYWGPSGTGKSRRALAEAGPGAYWLAKPEANGVLWFDGYEGQEVVVIDEFYGWIQRDKLQRMSDRYPLLVQTKNGTVPFLAKRIIITSNEHPATWWPKVGLGAMQRRLTGDLGKIELMETAWVPEQAPVTPVQPAPAAPPVCPGAPTRRALDCSESPLSESQVEAFLDEGVEWQGAPPSPHQGELEFIEEAYLTVGEISYDDW